MSWSIASTRLCCFVLFNAKRLAQHANANKSKPSVSITVLRMMLTRIDPVFIFSWKSWTQNELCISLRRLEGNFSGALAAIFKPINYTSKVLSPFISGSPSAPGIAQQGALFSHKALKSSQNNSERPYPEGKLRCMLIVIITLGYPPSSAYKSSQTSMIGYRSLRSTENSTLSWMMNGCTTVGFEGNIFGHFITQETSGDVDLTFREGASSVGSKADTLSFPTSSGQGSLLKSNRKWIKSIIFCYLFNYGQQGIFTRKAMTRPKVDRFKKPT